MLSADAHAEVDSHGSTHGSSHDSSHVLMEPCTKAALMKGWGVPTATDISLAWMFARLIFGNSHPAVGFLLLLAIVDDAIGMGIIAIFYSDPLHPVEPLWLLLVLAGGVVAFVLRKMRVNYWSPYVFLAGSLAWVGLLKAHVHPALALVPVVPFMPSGSHSSMHSSHAEDLGQELPDWGASPTKNASSSQTKNASSSVTKVTPKASLPQADDLESGANTKALGIMRNANMMLTYFHAEHAALHMFEHHCQLPVDFGLFFFGLSNAGVTMDNVGGVTVSVILALIIGKTLGIAGFALLGVKLGFPLPAGVSTKDVFVLACLGGIVLTVALFVSNSAFMDPVLCGQSKFGAVLSVFAALIAWLISRVWPSDNSEKALDIAEDVVEDVVAKDIVQLLTVQKRYGELVSMSQSRSLPRVAMCMLTLPGSSLASLARGVAM